MLSSTASVLGSAGQANYSTASAFLDALALHRRAIGLAGQSINWGPWAEVGLAAAQANRGERGASAGLASIAPARGVEAFLRILHWGTTSSVVMPFHFRRWSQSYPKAAAAPIFAELLREEGGAPRAQTGTSALRGALMSAEPSKRRAMLETHVREQIAKVLRLDASRIGPSTPLQSIGLDSLMALSLRNRLEESLGVQLSATFVWGYPTVTALAPHLADKMKIALEGGAAEGKSDDDGKDKAQLAAATREVTGLSEDEALAALLGGNS